MWKVMIVDDEGHAISRLTKLIQEEENTFEIVQTNNTVDQALKAVEEIEPDLVFLDIVLGNETGFDFLKQLTPVNFDVIFTTAHNEYAVEAFEYSAIHYLLKPITQESFKEALNRFRDKIDCRLTNERLENLLHNLEVHSSADKKIAVPSGQGISFYKVGEIIKLEADGNYSIIHLSNGKQTLVTRRLKYYESLLDTCDFFRVHQSHLVNLSYIEKYVKGKQSYLVMSNGEKIPVATRKKEMFLKQLAKNRQI